MMMIPPTAYDMFDKGVADGGVMNVVMVTDWKLYEVLNYYYMLDIGCGGFVALANQEFFHGLPAQDQQIFMDTMYDGTMSTVQESVDNWAEAFKIMEEVGATLTWPTEDELFEWKTVSEQQVVPLWRDKCLNAGVDSVTISNVYQHWLELRKEYIDKYNLK
jgi:TRAP-type C4-dicarboxylate transport system substrate-binding protein